MERSAAKRLVDVLSRISTAQTTLSVLLDERGRCFGGNEADVSWLKEIEAYSNGAVIEYRLTDTGTWSVIGSPSFLKKGQYRVKPPEPLKVWINVYNDDGRKAFGCVYATETEALGSQCEWRNPLGCFEFVQVMPK